MAGSALTGRFRIMGDQVDLITWHCSLVSGLHCVASCEATHPDCNKRSACLLILCGSFTKRHESRVTRALTLLDEFWRIDLLIPLTF